MKPLNLRRDLGRMGVFEDLRVGTQLCGPGFFFFWSFLV